MNAVRSRNEFWKNSLGWRAGLYSYSRLELLCKSTEFLFCKVPADAVTQTLCGILSSLNTKKLPDVHLWLWKSKLKHPNTTTLRSRHIWTSEKSTCVWFLRTNNSFNAQYSLESSIFLHKIHINPDLDARRKYFPQKSSPEAKYFQNWCLFINKCWCGHNTGLDWISSLLFVCRSLIYEFIHTCVEPSFSCLKTIPWKCF